MLLMCVKREKDGGRVRERKRERERGREGKGEREREREREKEKEKKREKGISTSKPLCIVFSVLVSIHPLNYPLKVD